MQFNSNMSMTGTVEARESALRDASEAYLSGHIDVAMYEEIERTYDIDYGSALLALAEGNSAHSSSSDKVEVSGYVLG